MSYRAWLEQQDYTLTPDDYAEHRNFLQRLVPLSKELQRLLRDYGRSDFPFDADELSALHAALRVLDDAAVPMALITKE